MKTRTKIVAFTFALLLVGSIAYAATERKKQAKLEIDESDLITEEDTLTAELLAPSDDNHKLPKTAAVMVDDTSVVKDIEKEAEQ